MTHDLLAALKKREKESPLLKAIRARSEGFFEQAMALTPEEVGFEGEVDPATAALMDAGPETQRRYEERRATAAQAMRGAQAGIAGTVRTVAETAALVGGTQQRLMVPGAGQAVLERGVGALLPPSEQVRAFGERVAGPITPDPISGFSPEAIEAAEAAFFPKVIEGVAGSVAYPILGVLTGGAGVAGLAVSQVAGSSYARLADGLSDYVESGLMTQEEANVRAAFGAGFESVLSAAVEMGMGVGALSRKLRKALKGEAGQRLYGNVVTRIAKISAGEGIEDGIQQELQVFTDQVFGTKGRDRQLWDSLVAGVPEAVEAAQLGAAVGGVFGPLGEIGRKDTKGTKGTSDLSDVSAPSVPRGTSEGAQPAHKVLKDEQVMSTPPAEAKKAVEALSKASGKELEVVTPEADSEMEREIAVAKEKGVELTFVQATDGSALASVEGAGRVAVAVHLPGQVVLDARASTQEQRRALLAHELWHEVQAEGEASKALFDLVRQLDPEGLDAQFKRAQRLYAKAEIVEEEAQAQYVEALEGWAEVALFDPGRLEQIVRAAHPEQRSVLMRILDALSKLVGLGTKASRGLAKAHEIIARTEQERRLGPEDALRVAQGISAGFEALQGRPLGQLAGQIDAAKTAAEKALKKLDDQEKRPKTATKGQKSQKAAKRGRQKAGRLEAREKRQALAAPKEVGDVVLDPAGRRGVVREVTGSGEKRRVRVDYGPVAPKVPIEERTTDVALVPGRVPTGAAQADFGEREVQLAERPGRGPVAERRQERAKAEEAAGVEPRFATARKAQDVELSRKTLEELEGLAERQEARIEKRERAILGDRYDEYRKLARRHKEEPLLDELEPDLSRRDMGFLEGDLGEDYFDELSLKEFQEAREYVQGRAEDEASIGGALGQAVFAFADAAGKAPTDMSFGELRAFAQFDEARIIAEDRGLDLALIESNAKKAAIGRFVGERIEIADIEFVFKGLREFGKEALEAPQRLMLPPGEARFATAPATDTPAFKKWFGKSKVVDEKGEPLVVYHGTSGKAFNQFLLGSGQRGGPGGEIYFTDSPEVASDYAATFFWTEATGSRVAPAYLSIQNAAEHDAKGAYWLAREDEKVREAQAFGKDGLIVRNVVDDAERGIPSTVYVVFGPAQVKSAIGNVGTFDPSTPDIRFATAAPGGSFSDPSQTRLEKTRTYFEAYFRPFERIQKRIAQTKGETEVAEAEDVVQAEALHYGARKEDLERIRQEARKIRRIVRSTDDPKAFFDKAADYLRALGAPKRNATIEARHPKLHPRATRPGSGRTSDGELLTDQLARRIVRDAQADPDFAKLERIREITRGILDRDLQLRIDEGLLSKEEAQGWRDAFGPDYVPMSSEEHDDTLSGYFAPSGGFSKRGPESKRAEGRSTVSGNPIVWALVRSTEVNRRVLHNRVGQAFGALVRGNEDADLWSVEEERPRVDPDQKVTVFKEEGEERYIVQKGREGERLYDAFQRLEVGSASELMKLMSPISRFYSGMATRWSPEFVPRNFVKDIQTAASNIAAKEGPAMAARVVSNAPQAVRAIFKVKRNPEATGEWADTYREARDLGFETGWSENLSYDEAFTDMQGLIDKGKMREAWTIFWGGWEKVNDAVENGVRLAAYREFVKSGISPTRAAFKAKNLTVNFNRKGRWGPGMNTAFIFFNAGVQGNVRMLTAIFKDPHGKQVALAWVAMGFLNGVINRMIGDDEEEKRWSDTAWWKKNAFMSIMLPETMEIGGVKVDRVMMPVAWGWNVLWATGIQLEEMIFGDASVADGTARIMGEMASAFDPMGGAATVPQWIAPTILDPFVQISENKTWYGGPIAPTNYGRGPDAHNYWPDTSPTAVDIAAKVNRLTGGTSKRSGLVDVSPESLVHWAEFFGSGIGRTFTKSENVFSRMVTGEELPVAEIPFVRSFIGAPDPRSVARRYRLFRNRIETSAAERKARDVEKEPEMLVFVRMLKSYKKSIKAAEDAGLEEKATMLMRDFNARVRTVLEDKE